MAQPLLVPANLFGPHVPPDARLCWDFSHHPAPPLGVAAGQTLCDEVHVPHRVRFACRHTRLGCGMQTPSVHGVGFSRGRGRGGGWGVGTPTPGQLKWFPGRGRGRGRGRSFGRGRGRGYCFYYAAGGNGICETQNFAYQQPTLGLHSEPEARAAVRAWFPHEYTLIANVFDQNSLEQAVANMFAEDASELDWPTEPDYAYANDHMDDLFCKAYVAYVVMALHFEFSNEEVNRSGVFWTKLPIAASGASFQVHTCIRAYKGVQVAGARQLHYEDLLFAAPIPIGAGGPPIPSVPIAISAGTCGALWRHHRCTPLQELYVECISRNITRRLEKPDVDADFLDSPGALVVQKLYNVLKHARMHNRTFRCINACMVAAVEVLTQVLPTPLNDTGEAFAFPDQYFLVPLVFGPAAFKNFKAPDCFTDTTSAYCVGVDTTQIGWVKCSLRIQPAALARLWAWTQEFVRHPGI